MSRVTSLQNVCSILSEEVLINSKFYNSISNNNSLSRYSNLESEELNQENTHNSYPLKALYFKAAIDSTIAGIGVGVVLGIFPAVYVSADITTKALIILTGLGLGEYLFTLGKSQTIYTNFVPYVDTCFTQSFKYSYIFFTFAFATVSTVVSFVIIAPISTVKHFFTRHLPKEQDIVFDKLYEATLPVDETNFVFVQQMLDSLSRAHLLEQQSAKQFYTNIYLREVQQAVGRYVDINKEFSHAKNGDRLLSPLGSAIFNGRTEIVKFLIQSGANITSKEIELAKTLVARENKNIENEKICGYIEKNIFNTITLPNILMANDILSKINNEKIQLDKAEKLKDFTLNVTDPMNVLQDVMAYI